MDHAEFWRLIGTIDLGALNDGDEEAAVEPIVDALAESDQADILKFEDILAQSLYDLDGQAYADEAADSGKSGDGFLYIRCFVVAKGKRHYDSVLMDPSKMPKSLDEWCESLLYVSQKAWAASTRNDEIAWDHVPPVSYETGSNRAEWK